MNRADFLNMIESRSPVDRRMLGEVYELINIFPYFHSAHLLLLKGLQDNNDVRFENQLKNSAIHIPNRELLYHYLKNDLSAASVQEEVSILQPIDVQPDSETESTVIEEARNSNVLIEELERVSESAPGEKQEEPDESTEHSIFIQADSDDDESPAIMIIHENVNDSSEEILSLADEDFSPSAEDDLLELIDDEEAVEEIPVAKPEASDKNSRKQRQSELIDKFIITNPRIEPSREKTDVPLEDLSKPQSDESGVFVTDTLAQIYVHQGYYSKAIDIYEKLSLKFPEKSSYFATQIEKVKEYLKK